MIKVTRSSGGLYWAVWYNDIQLEHCHTRKEANKLKAHYEKMVHLL